MGLSPRVSPSPTPSTARSSGGEASRHIEPAGQGESKARQPSDVSQHLVSQKPTPPRGAGAAALSPVRSPVPGTPHPRAHQPETLGPAGSATIETVPAAEPSASSAGPLTASAQPAPDEISAKRLKHCLEKLDLDAYGDDDVCQATATAVFKNLTGGVDPKGLKERGFEALMQDLRQAQPPEFNRAYLVFAANIGHSFALARCGNQALVLQSFVQSYSMREWVDGARSEDNPWPDPAGTPKLEDHPWLPTRGARSTTEIGDEFAALSGKMRQQDHLGDMRKLFCIRKLEPMVELSLASTKQADPDGLLLYWQCAPIHQRLLED